MVAEGRGTAEKEGAGEEGGGVAGAVEELKKKTEMLRYQLQPLITSCFRVQTLFNSPWCIYSTNQFISDYPSFDLYFV